jgi:hypothetical protein
MTCRGLFGNWSSVSPSAVVYCHDHGVSVIAGSCPMMCGDGVNLGHKYMQSMIQRGLGQGTVG